MLEENPVGRAAEKRIAELEALEEKLTSSLAKASKGVLHSEGKSHFYMIEGGKRIYLGKDKTDLIKTLAQRDYEEKLLTFTRKRLKELREFCESEDIDCVFQKLSDNRKELVEAYTMNDRFVEAWKQEPYERWDDGLLEGDVRSKSEELIANFLTSHNISFKYELELQHQTGSFRPDFTCLNRRTGAKIIWEHFGLMDEKEYAEKTIKKIQIYSSLGFVQGINLIMTFETKEYPFTAKYLKQFLPILT